MIATLCRIYSKEHPNQIGSLDPWLKSLVNYWARIAVSFKRQYRGFNSFTDNYHFIRQNGQRFTCVLGLALLLFMLISIFGLRGMQSFRDFREMGSFSVAIVLLGCKNDHFSIFRKDIFSFVS